MRNIITILITLALVPQVRATVHLVPDSMPTIEAAAAVSGPGDTIQLAPGVYTGTGNRDIDLSGKQLTVLSEQGPEVTTINCGGSSSEPHRAFVIKGSDAAVEIAGITIQNGYVVLGDTIVGDSGGAILARDLAVITIQDCNFFGNFAGDNGGAIMADSVSLTLFNCTFLNNSCGNRGGALRSRWNLPLSVHNCVFDSNLAQAGGAVNTWDVGSAIFDSCSFVGNHATNGAGAFRALNSSCQVSNCTFTGNSSVRLIGALSAGGIFEIVDCLFESNTTGDSIWDTTLVSKESQGTVDTPYGSEVPVVGVEFDEISWQMADDADKHTISIPGWAGAAAVSQATIRRTSFINNKAAGRGSAIYSANDSVHIDSCEFIGNQALASTGEGGAIHMRNNVLWLHNSTFRGNRANYAAGAAYLPSGRSDIDNCIFESDSTFGWGGSILYLKGDHTIDSSLFIRSRVEAYRGTSIYIAECSPAFSNCTWFDNGGGLGGVIALDSAFPQVTNSIISFSPDGKALHRYDSLSEPDISCTDIYGNAGGDWIDFIEHLEGENNNFSLHPLFCDSSSNDLAIAYESACAPANNPCQIPIGGLDTACTCCLDRGNVDHLAGFGGPVDVADLSFLVAYLFQGGPEPPCEPEADVDTDCQFGCVTVADLSYLVAYLFLEGPAPQSCP